MIRPFVLIACCMVIASCAAAFLPQLPPETVLTNDPAPHASDSLKARIVSLIAEHPDATVGVAIIDSSSDTHLEILGDRVFHAASTMKLPVLIELFRQAEKSYFSLNDSLLVENRFLSIVDGTPFRIEDDSDDFLYATIGRRVPVRELAERMITVSSNLATNLIIELVSADSVQKTIERMGARTMRVLRGVEDLKAFERGLNNTATASDLAVLLEAVRRGEAVSTTASEEIVWILLDQEYDAMIPAGLPAGVRAAHKTGWITGITHDAAIVYPENGAPYVLVILIEGPADHDAASRLGAAITRVVHHELRPGG